MNLRYTLIEFAGPEAMSFLQAQLATDLRPMIDSSWRWAALCSVKGRVIATGALMRFDQQRWRWLIAASVAPRLVQHLSLYVLRRKLTIERIEPTCIRAESVPDAPGLDEQLQRLQVSETGNWVLDQLPAGWRVELYFDPAQNATKGANLDEWEAARMRHGMALIDQCNSETHLAHALGLDRLRAISVAKGCYPGQEIVARTHYLGQSKRTLVVCEGVSHKLSEAVEITLDGQMIGEMVEIAGEGTALAVVRSDALQAPLWGSEQGAIRWHQPQLPNTATAQPQVST